MDRQRLLDALAAEIQSDWKGRGDLRGRSFAMLRCRSMVRNWLLISPLTVGPTQQPGFF